MSPSNETFKNLGVVITLKDPEDFLKIVETLTRIGVLSRDDVLTQTCHILHKRGEYAILHFKELFELDGNSKTSISEEDIDRRNGIVSLLKQWGLCDADVPSGFLKKTKIVPFNQKHKYTFKQNYTIGSKKTKT